MHSFHNIFVDIVMFMPCIRSIFMNIYDCIEMFFKIFSHYTISILYIKEHNYNLYRMYYSVVNIKSADIWWMKIFTWYYLTSASKTATVLRRNFWKVYLRIGALVIPSLSSHYRKTSCLSSTHYISFLLLFRCKP